jgi:acyl-coenzyme A thioesterase PaaI-like protein
MSRFLENARKMISGEVPPPGAARLVGFRLVAVEPGHSRFEMHADARHHNPMGTLHGGILCDIAECLVSDENGRLVARATSTCMTLRGEQARGR